MDSPHRYNVVITFMMTWEGSESFCVMLRPKEGSHLQGAGGGWNGPDTSYR
jgi:hypothetical protein